MSIDGIMLAAIKKDLNENLLNGRIDKIYQLDKYEITLLIRNNNRNYKILVSAHPNYPRIHITEENFKHPLKAPDFCMLLRKYLLRGTITSIKQPEFERILNIEIKLYDNNYNLIIEIMGRHSNIILLNQDGIILDAIKRVTARINRERELFPGLKYIYPPGQNKLNPLDLTKDSFKDRTTDFNLATYKAIMNNYRGISPYSAREIVYRAGIDPEIIFNELNEEEKNSIWSQLKELKEKIVKEEFQPAIGLEGNNITYISAYPLTYRDEQKRLFQDTGKLLDFYYQVKIKDKQLNNEKNQLFSITKNYLNKNLKKRNSFLKELKIGENAVKFKKIGDLIIANIYQLKKGMSEAELIDYYDPEQKKTRISLDPLLSPSNNAQKYFKKYNKAKKSIKYIKVQLKKLWEEERYLENVLLNIEQTESIDELKEVRDELIIEGYIKEQKKKKEKSTAKALPPYKFISSDGYDILVGRNNHQNDKLTKKIANSQDLWLHIKDLAGSHVIIRKKDKEDISAKTIKEAAILAAYYSKGRISENVAIDYTQVKNVRKPKGAKSGLVYYDNYQTVYVTPDKELVEKLKK